jgi:large subunit ribosomal protein L6
MSKIGEAPIQIPNGISVIAEGETVVVKGPLGELTTKVPRQIKIEIEDNIISVKRKNEDKFSRSLHGLIRSLIANTVVGVEKGWEKKLELIGVGYRTVAQGEKLILNVGYSHPVEVEMPAGVKFLVSDNTKITISGIDKILVGQVAAKIRDVRPPEPYKGKGIRYVGEYVRRKAGKAGKVGAGAVK